MKQPSVAQPRIESALEPQPQQEPLILADGIQLSGAAWSLALNFAQTRVIGSQVTTSPAVTVSVSWPLAKALHDMLGGVLERFEEAEGTIAVPKSFKARPAQEVSVEAPTQVSTKRKPSRGSKSRRP